MRNRDHPSRERIGERPSQKKTRAGSGGSRHNTTRSDGEDRVGIYGDCMLGLSPGCTHNDPVHARDDRGDPKTFTKAHRHPVDSGFGILVSFGAVINTLVGGLGSFFGPLWGAAIMQILEEVTTRYTDRVELVAGLILILVIMFAPMGFVGGVRILKQKWLARFASRAQLEKAS